jgi:glycosyltransferase involved in cell wall biosynthesis
MRVLLLSGEDLAGGGHRAAFRLHRALRGIGVESFMAVQRKHSSDPHVHQMTQSELGWPPIARGYLDMMPPFLWRQRDEPISLGLQSANLDKLVERFRPDIINLHWINGGIASIRSIGMLPIPVVYTLHDMWAFTGGCYYSGDCLRYQAECQRCPKLKSVFGADFVTRWVHQRKRRHWGNKPLHAITPSAWMRNLTLSSSLFGNADVTHIRNCVDPTVFNGHAREKTRNELGLPVNSKAILFSSANQPRKGALIIPEVIRILRANTPNSEWRFLFMGGLPPAFEKQRDVVVLHHTTNEARVANYYAAADVYALPSLEDNLPNTVSESLCSGTPVAAFPTGGIVEMVQPGINGELAQYTTAQGLADVIQQVFTSCLLPRVDITAAAHAMYSPTAIARAHLECFKKPTGTPVGRN